MKLKNNNQGFIAFASLLVISAVTLAIAVSISLLGVGEANNALSSKKGQEALAVAYSCGEEAMLRLKRNANYSGGGLNVGKGSCNVTITGSGADRQISVSAKISGPPLYEKKIEITVKQTGNSLNLISWQEIP